MLTERGVEIRAKARVKTVTQENLSLVDGVSIPTRNLVWTAGAVPSPLIFRFRAEKNKADYS